MTLAFAGSTVNHAKTGGGWLRLADLEATLDKSGNGVVSAVVSYGTMSPPAVFDPATAPVRGPERVDLVDLSGNAVAPDRGTRRRHLGWTERRLERRVPRLPRR